jgi:kynureninase
LLDDVPERIALAANTHELVVRFLSALGLRKRPRLVTTDAEFHTIRRQLDRLAEEGIDVVRIAALPAATLAERLAKAVDSRTAAVLVSAVLYTNAHIVPNLRAVLEACERVGAELLVDAYHALNVVPFSLKEEGLERAYVVGGGYKYCQLGPGNAFLRFPADTTLRPVATGWFSEFTDLSKAPSERVEYGPGPARFAGATYDFTSHYRGAAVFRFVEEQGLTVERLQELSQHQVRTLASGLAFEPDVPITGLAGFLAFPSAEAPRLHEALKQEGIWTDYRGDVLRLGPAPYLTDGQVNAAASALGAALRKTP